MHVDNNSCTPFYGAQTPKALVAMLLASMMDDVICRRLLRSNGVSRQSIQGLADKAVSLLRISALHLKVQLHPLLWGSDAPSLGGNAACSMIDDVYVQRVLQKLWCEQQSLQGLD